MKAPSFRLHSRHAILLFATMCLAGCITPAEAAAYKICPSGQQVRKNVACPTAPPSFSAQDATVAENAGSVTVTVNKAGTATKSSLVGYATSGGTSVSGTNYSPVSGTASVAAAQTSFTFSVPIKDDGVIDPTLTLGIKLTGTSNATIARNAIVYITDTDTVIPVTPNDNPLTGQSPGVGAPDIATTDHNVLNDLQPAWGTGVIPPLEVGIGAFRFLCRHTTLLYDDPTVYPNQPGASHLHDQTGVYGWNANSNYGNLRAGGGGSGCNDVAGADRNQTEITWSANRTPYWQPALLDGKGNVIIADYTSYYYKARPFAGPMADQIVTNPANSQYEGQGVALPNAIKFIFGADLHASPAVATNFRFSCTLPDTNTDYPTMAEAIACVKASSAAGAQLEVHQDAMTCWNGVDLDTADHRSHLSYPSYGSWGYQKCDAQHPYVIPAFTYAVFYTILPSDDGDIHFSSDEMDNGQPRGWSFHVDYGPASWDPTVLKMWTDGCINQSLNCSGGDLGNGKQLKGASQPIYYDQGAGTYTQSWRNPQRLVPVPVHP